MLKAPSTTTISFIVTTTNATNSSQNGASPEIHEWFQGIIISILVFAFFIGTVGNILVCHIITKRKKKRSIHILTLNLAISDLVVLLIYLPYQIYIIQSRLKWEFGPVTCSIVSCVNSSCVNASIGTLVAITRDRYIAVVTPMRAHSRDSNVIRKWIILIWSMSLIVTMPLLFVVDVQHNFCIEVWPSPKYEKLYWIFVFVVQLVLPLIFISACYVIIIHQLKTTQIPTEMVALHSNNNNNNNYNDGEFRSSKRKVKRKKQQRKMLKMSITLVVVYTICVLPQHAIFLASLNSALELEEYAVYVYLLSNFLMSFNSSINPVVYGTLNDEIKRGFRKFLCCDEYLNLFHSFRNSVLRIRKRTATSTSTNTISTTQNSSTKKMSVQFELCAVTRIDNL